MSDRDQPVIIIRKKKKGHAGHHGGAWKVAYADFVTAMMAFFLMMWLLNTTTSDQRKGIADYFAPMSVSTSFGGSGGPMGGTSITSSTGAEISDSSPPGVDNQTLATVGKGENGDEDTPGKSEKSAEGGKSDKEAQTLTPAEIAAKDAAQLAEAMKSEEQKFGEAEGLLKSAITQTPGLKDLADHLVIDRTPEGLRIQIIDKDGFSLFPSGSSIPYEKGQNLLRLVGRVISRLPNMISVTGHTDSAPFSPNSRRNNWDLSSERANVSRDELEAGGVRPDRIARIVGLSDRDPFIANDPKDPRNRRISIVLLRQNLASPFATPAKPQLPAEQAIPASAKPPAAKTQP